MLSGQRVVETGLVHVQDVVSALVRFQIEPLL